jgi:16S rRNA processing protein RimM
MSATKERQWVAVGVVGRPHGLDGSFVVESPSAEPRRFARGARVYAGREPAAVVATKRAGGRLVVRLDRPVERGTPLELPVDELPPLPEGEYYAFELVGLAVEDADGRTLGLVGAVAPGVANDVLELDSGIALPLVEDCVRTVDLEAGRIVVEPGLLEASD